MFSPEVHWLVLGVQKRCGADEACATPREEGGAAREQHHEKEDWHQHQDEDRIEEMTKESRVSWMRPWYETSEWPPSVLDCETNTMADEKARGCDGSGVHRRGHTREDFSLVCKTSIKSWAGLG